MKLTILLWQGTLALPAQNDPHICCKEVSQENQDNVWWKDTNSSLWVVHPYHPGTLQCELETDGQQLGSHHFPPNFQPHLLLHKEKKTYFVGKWCCLSPETQVQAMQTCKSNLWLGSIPQQTNKCMEAKESLLAWHKNWQSSITTLDGLVTYLKKMCPTFVWWKHEWHLVVHDG